MRIRSEQRAKGSIGDEERASEVVRRANEARGE